jgi:hypothetical protein
MSNTGAKPTLSEKTPRMRHLRNKSWPNEIREAQGCSEQTIDAVAKAIARFEAYIRYKDFKAFHIEQAKAFRRDLVNQRSHQSGGR